jgi:hypothetical protein
MSPISSTDNRLHLAVAGTGNPYEYLTPQRLELLYTLFDGPDEAAAARAVGLTAGRLDAELAVLTAASLVGGTLGARRPAFFIAASDELPGLDVRARELGQALAKQLEQRWPLFQERYAQLGPRRNRHLLDDAFFLVGDLVLDVGLLDALAAETTLMPPAPPRPSPDAPEARYYAWLIEGPRSLLGQYGQRVTPLPWRRYELRTFGDYWTGDEPNYGRVAVEERARSLAPDLESINALAEGVNVWSYTDADAAHWWAFARGEARLLAATLAAHEDELRGLFAGLRATQLPGTSFGEFFCWYDHVIYAHAIDALTDGGLISMPSERFTAAIWPAATESAF